MIMFPFLILILIVFVRVFKGMFPAFLILVATKSIMDAYWDVRVGPLSFSSVAGVLIPVLFYPVLLNMHTLPKKWVLNGKQLLVLYSCSLLFAAFVNPLLSLENLLVYINIFMGFLLIPLLITDKQKFKKLLIAIIISGIFPIIVSFYQFQTGIIFSERQTAGLTRYVGLYHDGFPVRFYGLFTIFSCVLYLTYFKLKNKVYTILLITLIVCALFSVYLVFSKAAVAIISLWVLVLLTFSQAKLKFFFIFLVFIALVYACKGDVIFSNIEQLFSKEVGYNDGTYRDVRYTLAGRGYIWEDLWEFWLFKQTPLFQWTGDGINRPAHNEFLRVLLVNGILGLILFIIFLLRNIHCVVFKTNKKVRVFGIMLLGMFFIDCLGLTVGDYYYYNIITWGFIGLFITGSKNDILENS